MALRSCISPRSTMLGLALIVCVGLVASACSSGSADQSVAAEQQADQAVDVGSSEPAVSADSDDGGGDESDKPKTLDDYLGGAAAFVRGGGGGGGGGRGGGAGVDSEVLAEEQELIQQQIQVCMLEQGFEYTPELPAGLRIFLVTEDVDLTPVAYAETKGFGISTRFDSILDGEVELETDTDDPNDEYLSTLAEADADAWQFALRGAPPERNAQGQLIDPDTGEIIPRGQAGRTAGGCSREAQIAVRGDLSGLADLQDEFELLDERIDADPEVVKIRTGWATCMRSAGFAWDTEADARSEFQGDFQPLLRSFFTGGGGAGGGGQGGGGGGGVNERLANLVEQGLTNEQEVALKALQEREIAAAIASLDCWGEGREEITAITATYEAEFVETNRAALEALG